MEIPMRIKFLSLLKKVKCENDRTTCCIEIVPQLYSLQKVEQISSFIHGKTVECTVPMNYKILIKKQDSEKKVYHSCVDLVRVPSNQTESGFGDVPRVIISDNYFLRKSSEEKCDLILEKSILNPKEVYGKIITKKTACIQVSKQKNWEDKSLEINIKNDTTDQASQSQGDLCISNIYQQTEVPPSTNKNNWYDIYCPKTSKCGDGKNYAENKNEGIRSCSPRCRLSLSPMCSLCTKESPTVRQIHKTTTYVFPPEDSPSKTSEQNCERNYSYNIENEQEINESIVYYNPSNFNDILHSEHKITIQKVNTVPNMNQSNSNVREFHNTVSYRNKPGSVSFLSLTKPDSYELVNNIQNEYGNMSVRPNQHPIKTKVNNFTKSNINRNCKNIMTQSQMSGREKRGLPNTAYIASTSNGVDVKLNENNLINYQFPHEDLCISNIDKKRYTDLNKNRKYLNKDHNNNFFLFESPAKEQHRRKSEIKFISLVNDVERIISRTNFSFCRYPNDANKKDHNPTKQNGQLRLRPEVRVANFIKQMHKEIQPIKVMMDEIKYRCVILGLGKFNKKPKTNSSCSSKQSMMYQSIPDESKNNRVVYTVLFQE